MLGNSYFISRLDNDGTGCSFANSTLINVSNPTTTQTDIPFTSVPFTGTAVSEPVTTSFLPYSESMICGGVGVNEIEMERALFVFPNPVQDELGVTSEEFGIKDREISIYNVMGKKLMDGPLGSAERQDIKIDVSDLTPGIYFIKIAEGEKIFSGKFMKE